MPPAQDEGAEGDYSGEDTIVVKGERNWSHPSSPESMSSEIEPLVSNILKQINTPRNQELESPEPLEEETTITKSNPPSITRRISSTDHRQSRSRQRVSVLTMEERLMQMPELRQLPWREGVEAGADNETGGDSRRKQIRFGCLLATRGQVQPNPCNSCANGRGKFAVCVALDGFFKGACASCQLSGRPNRCSIKKNDDDTPESATANTPVVKDRPSNTKKPTQPSSEDRQIKRRRTETTIIPTPKSAPGPQKVPDWESARPQWQQALGDSQARQRTGNIAQPWATVNHSMPTPTPQPIPNGMTSRAGIPQPAIEPRTSLSWATVNQPAPAPPSQSYQNGGSLSVDNHRNSHDQSKREETIPHDSTSALIDTLPKNKQRQVYGLMSGLQGGIEHLQRELDSLKRALGIEGEE